MIENELNTRRDEVLAAAHAMMSAARTAPKARGIDNLTILTVTGDDLPLLAAEMRRYGERTGRGFFLRDADNIEYSGAVVVIGTPYSPFGLDCGFCGWASCNEKPDDQPCVFNTNDLGIALGSAAGIAADRRLDSRIMYSAGRCAMDMGWLPGCTMALAIALSVGGKNPFFDR